MKHKCIYIYVRYDYPSFIFDSLLQFIVTFHCDNMIMHNQKDYNIIVELFQRKALYKYLFIDRCFLINRKKITENCMLQTTKIEVNLRSTPTQSHKKHFFKITLHSIIILRK